MTQDVTTEQITTAVYDGVQTAQAVDHPDTAPQGPVFEFAMLDPHEVVIEDNVRTIADLDPRFVASIKERGVLTDVTAVRGEDGVIRVRMGQMRTLAARLTGQMLPTRIMDAGPEVDRFIDQVVENHHRHGLTQTDTLAAYEQMHLKFGLSEAAIARRVKVPRKAVKTALTVARSTASRQQMVAAGLTLDQAAILVEFEDHPEVHASLVKTAAKNPAALDHAAQRARDDIAHDLAYNAAVEALTAQGITHVPQPDYSDRTQAAVTDLADADGQRYTAETHATCPGHSAYLRSYAPFTAVYVCTDVKGNQHARFDPYGGLKPVTTTEEDRAARREVLANNKAWRSAETVRRGWLKKFAARRTAPKDAPVFLAYTLANATIELEKARTDGYRLAVDLLGLTGGYGRDALTTAISNATPARAQVIALTVALAAIEHSTSVQTWRMPSGNDARYLRALREWGYHLSDVEALVIAEDDATQATAAEPQPQPEDIQDGQTDDLDPAEYDDAE